MTLVCHILVPCNVHQLCYPILVDQYRSTDPSLQCPLPPLSHRSNAFSYCVETSLIRSFLPHFWIREVPLFGQAAFQQLQAHLYEQPHGVRCDGEVRRSSGQQWGLHGKVHLIEVHKPILLLNPVEPQSHVWLSLVCMDCIWN